MHALVGRSWLWNLKHQVEHPTSTSFEIRSTIIFWKETYSYGHWEMSFTLFRHMQSRQRNVTAYLVLFRGSLNFCKPVRARLKRRCCKAFVMTTEDFGAPIV